MYVWAQAGRFLVGILDQGRGTRRAVLDSPCVGERVAIGVGTLGAIEGCADAHFCGPVRPSGSDRGLVISVAYEHGDPIVGTQWARITYGQPEYECSLLVWCELGGERVGFEHIFRREFAAGWCRQQPPGGHQEIAFGVE